MVISIKKSLKIVFISLIFIFSFYYVYEIKKLLLTDNDLIKTIEKKESLYQIKSIDATLKEEYVTPGLNGKKINVIKSYYNMKDFSSFNEYYLVYDEIIPNNSIKDNKDKIINKGNKQKNKIYLIFYYDKDKINYFENNNLKASVLINYHEFNDIKLEQINTDNNEYNRLNNLLKSKNLNNDLCYASNNLKDICIKHKKYLFKENKILTNNISEIKNNIESGDIILIDSNIDSIKILIKEINYKGLELEYISEIINEQLS